MKETPQQRQEKIEVLQRYFQMNPPDMHQRDWQRDLAVDVVDVLREHALKTTEGGRLI